MRKLLIVFSWAMMYCLSSCNKEELVAIIPSYVTVDSVFVETNLLTEGTASHRITTVWVEVNGQAQGVYELPATFPVASSGTTKIRIDAGINENGTSSTRSIYPFFAHYETNLELSPLDTANLRNPDGSYPSVRYYPSADIIIIEDFEGVGLNLENSPNSDTSIFRITDSSLLFKWMDEANKAIGAGYLPDRNTIFEARSGEDYEIPEGGPVFLEMNYKTDVPIVVGMYINSFTAGIIQARTAQVNPTDTWKKIYINLYSEVNGYPNVVDYKIFIGALNLEGRGTKTLYIDNLKLVF